MHCLAYKYDMNDPILRGTFPKIPNILFNPGKEGFRAVFLLLFTQESNGWMTDELGEQAADSYQPVGTVLTNTYSYIYNDHTSYSHMDSMVIYKPQTY